MFSTTHATKKRPVAKNPLEVDSHESKTQRSVVDSILGTNYSENRNLRHESSNTAKKRESFVLFDSRTDNESRKVPQQIAEIKNQIDRQVIVLQKQTNQFSKEVASIQKEVLNSTPEKSGIYHVRFLEFLLSLLDQLSTRIGEANSWLGAMKSRKAKRGSAFAVRSKLKGTQYSLSQELSSARSVM